MSLCNALKTFCVVSSARKIAVFSKHVILQSQSVNYNQVRNMRRAFGRIGRCMKLRRKIAGPEKQRKRSDWLTWNYDAELYAFNKRLHENISEETLRCIFVHDSYIRIEEQKRKDIFSQDVQFDLKSNRDLIQRGGDIMNRFILRYLRVAFHLIPEEGIFAVRDYLSSDDVLSNVSTNIGTKDLIFSAEYPPNISTLANTLRAIVGGIANDDSVAKAETFTLDFVCPQLINKDIFEIWELNNPLQILNEILQKQGQEATEPRLIFESGRNTLEAIYCVGLYSGKQFSGKGVGETLNFAEEMAAFDALRRLFHLHDAKAPTLLGEKAKLTNFE